MTAPTISEYLSYANLQMAAEAFIRDESTGQLWDSGDLYINALVRGNDHASRFVTSEAQKFTEEWEVLDQRANTATGFSGTLFHNSKTDELVLSIRSTEFIDDAARDNQATNSMEIKPCGWAFGQIDDMEKRYAPLKTAYAQEFAAANNRFTVTGYSLGRHLATAFNLLRREDGTSGQTAATYTFNGAGVGETTDGATLTQVMNEFKHLQAACTCRSRKKVQYYQKSSCLRLPHKRKRTISRIKKSPQ